MNAVLLEAQVFLGATLIWENNFRCLVGSLSSSAVSTSPNSTVRNFKIKTIRSFETSGIAHPTTQRHIPKHLNSQQHSCENFRSSVKMLYIPITRTIIITNDCVFVTLAALSWSDNGYRYVTVTSGSSTRTEGLQPSQKFWVKLTKYPNKCFR